MRTPKHKVTYAPEFREVIYDEGRWRILKGLRRDALRIMEVLNRCGFRAITHGSIARGDVDAGSDVDIVIPYVVGPFRLELCLEDEGFNIARRYIVKATPFSTPKAYIELDLRGLRTVSFPLKDLSIREWEFYRFGGLLGLDDLHRGRRVPGVSKNLILIIPIENGHREAPVIGYENYVAKVVGISIETVYERVKVLKRRDRLGRTGVFLSYVLNPKESFEEVLDKLKDLV